MWSLVFGAEGCTGPAIGSARGRPRWRAFGAEGFPDNGPRPWHKRGRGRAAQWPFAYRPPALALMRGRARGIWHEANFNTLGMPEGRAPEAANR
jgi:hypothetical protein